MDNEQKEHRNLINYFSLKIFIGVGFVILGSRLIFKVDTATAIDINDVMSNFLDVIIGILTSVLGAGLMVLGVSDKKQEEKDSINIFIGKQLFEKGLQGLVLGVLVGILTAALNQLS